jgi:pimeloyl-ACP methyl ester carboxylesterase
MSKAQSQDGTTIAYEGSGNGPALLLIHGGGSHPDRWKPIAARFEPSYTVYRMARRGVGESGDALDHSPQRQGEDIAAVIDAIAKTRHGRVHVLAHSYGAICALEAALVTDKMAKLILYEPPYKLPLPPLEFVDRLGSMIEAGDRDGAWATFNRTLVRMPEQEIEAQRAQPAHAGRLASVHTLVSDLRAMCLYTFDPAKMRAVTTPVMLLLGGDSPAYFRESAELAQAALLHSRIVVLPGQQHIAMDTAPDLFVREVAAFLQEEE